MVKYLVNFFRWAPLTTIINNKVSIPGVANLRLFEGLFVAIVKCTRVPFSFLCYNIFKNYYHSVYVSKCLLNY